MPSSQRFTVREHLANFAVPLVLGVLIYQATEPRQPAKSTREPLQVSYKEVGWRQVLDAWTIPGTGQSKVKVCLVEVQAEADCPVEQVQWILAPGSAEQFLGHRVHVYFWDPRARVGSEYVIVSDEGALRPPPTPESLGGDGVKVSR